MRTCFGFAITTFLNMRSDYRRDGRCIARRLDNHFVIFREFLRKGRQKRASHVNAPKPFQLSVIPSHRFGESSVNVQSNDAHAQSLPFVSFEMGAGGQHDIY